PERISAFCQRSANFVGSFIKPLPDTSHASLHRAEECPQPKGSENLPAHIECSPVAFRNRTRELIPEREALWMLAREHSKRKLERLMKRMRVLKMQPVAPLVNRSTR